MGAGAGAGRAAPRRASKGSPSKEAQAASPAPAPAPPPDALPAGVASCAAANKHLLTIDGGHYGGKIMCIARRLKTVSGKAVVATTFASVLRLGREAFRAEGIDAVVLEGSPAARAAAVGDFVSRPSARVLLLAIGSDNAGLTLTCANEHFVLDPVFSPGVMAQLIGRIQRQGQQRECRVYHMAVQGSVEERIIAMRCARRADGDGGDGAGAVAGAGASAEGDANAASARDLSAHELLRLLDA